VRASSGIIQVSTLFRGNDIASHLLSAYCQSVGRNFLVEVMRPLVEQVLALYAQNKSMEVVLSLSLSLISSPSWIACCPVLTLGSLSLSRSIQREQRRARTSKRTCRRCTIFVSSSSTPSPAPSSATPCKPLLLLAGWASLSPSSLQCYLTLTTHSALSLSLVHGQVAAGCVLPLAARGHQEVSREQVNRPLRTHAHG
jgi:hypothetical protein